MVVDSLYTIYAGFAAASRHNYWTWSMARLVADKGFEGLTISDWPTSRTAARRQLPTLNDVSAAVQHNQQLLVSLRKTTIRSLRL